MPFNTVFAMFSKLCRYPGVVCLLLCSGLIHAGEVSVAVASNFLAPLEAISAEFTRESGHKVNISSGSTGKIYAQIQHGAPYQIFLSADNETPAKLVSEGLAEQGSQFTYAIGQLALWSPVAGYVDNQADVLRQPSFKKLAIANPALAPYGKAAAEVLAGMGLLEKLTPLLVQGENIAQTYQFVATGNAELGFVALSQVMKGGKVTTGSAWVVPADLHAPIRQDAVLLTAGKANPAAVELLEYLRGEQAREIIRAYGYGI